MKNLIVKAMLDELIATKGLSIASVVKQTGISGKTIRRILKNSTNPSIKTEMNLISFYCISISALANH